MSALEGALPELHSDIDSVIARPASPEALDAVHPSTHIERVREACDRAVESGEIIGLDADTMVSPGSWAAAMAAVGCGADAVDAVLDGTHRAAFCPIRPPGHHATRDRAMGFCLFNNIAIATRHAQARASVDRVLIVDWDVHHGNGTQDVFYDDPNVLFVSFHQYPWYPYTGAPEEIGTGEGTHATVNVAVPAGTTGHVYRSGVEEVVAPVLAEFRPTWLLLSLGFDAHRADPLTDLGLTSADYADVVRDLLSFAPPGRRLVFLEGGYDLQALSDSAAAVAAVLVNESHRPEEATTGGPGSDAVETARRIHVDGRLA